MAITNKFPGKCNNPACPDGKNKSGVGVGQGYITKINDRWVTWCGECVPAQKEPESTRRVLTADGKIFTPYEADNLPLIKTLKGPGGSPWPKFINKESGGPCWAISLEQGDRQRLLEVASQLGLEIAPQLRAGNVVTEEAQNAVNAGLYEFQVQGVNWMSNRDKALLADDMGLGKSQPLTSKILTPTGWTTMGKIAVGDEVVGRDGQPHSVMAIFPQGKLPIFKVEFSDGSSAECSDDHLWAVNTATRNKRSSPYKVLPLSEIKNSLKDSANNNRHFIPMLESPAEMKPQRVPISPWLIGYLAANGGLTTNTPRVTAPDKESADLVADSLPQGMKMQPMAGSEIEFYLSGDNAKFDENPLAMILKDLGLMGKGFAEKFVPHVYLFNNVIVRRDVLRGLMDGDGSVTASNNHLEYSTGSKQLASDVVFLVQSLGGTAAVVERIPTYTYKGEKKSGSLSYRISIKMPPSTHIDMNPFVLSRKAGVYKESPKYRPSRAIVSVTLLGEEECQCISVDAKDHLYITDDFVATHNTVQALVSIPAKGQALVVAPAGLKYNWKAEAAVWRPDLKVTVLEGGKSFRFPKVGELVITNYDILPDFLDPTPKVQGQKKATRTNWTALKEWRRVLKDQHQEAAGVVVIFDEAHKVKNYKTERARKVRELSRLCGKVWGLTGTPLDNQPEDLFGVLDSLNMAFDVFTPCKGQTPLGRFHEVFGATSGRFGTSFGTPHPIVPELLRRVMLRRRRTEVLPNLPTKTYTNLVVGSMGSALKEALDDLWDEEGLALEVNGSLPPFEKMSEIRAKLAQANIPAMLEYVEECEEQGCPLVVFSSHLAPIDALLTRPGWAVITGATSPEKRQQIVDAFQAGRLKGVGLTIRAGGVGLTLTHAWKVLFVDLDWVPGWNAQAEDRVCRIGQASNKVEIVRMVNDHPLTLHILRTLHEKTRKIEAAVEKFFTVNVPKGLLAKVGDSESASAFADRMERIQKAQEEAEASKAAETLAQAKARAKGKVGLIHEREKARNTRPLQPLTPVTVAQVRESFKFMLSVCDGACLRDGEGFNKPDASVAHCLLTAGLETDQEVEAAFYMLVRYHRQLSGNYPLLFGK